jgi:hypothetical protein
MSAWLGRTRCHRTLLRVANLLAGELENLSGRDDGSELSDIFFAGWGDNDVCLK